MAKVSIPSAVVQDNNTVVPKPRGTDALRAHQEEFFSKTEEPKQETVRPIITGEATVSVLCKENGRYRYGNVWLVLSKNKRVMLPVGAAKEYKSKGKVDY